MNKKIIVFGIIFLFLGAGSVSAINLDIKNSKIENKDNITETTDSDEYPIIGGVNITFPFGEPKIEWWVAKDRNFTYPIENGKVIIKCKIIVTVKSNSLYIMPWIVVAHPVLYTFCDDIENVLDDNLGLTMVPFYQFEPRLYPIPLEGYPLLVPSPECNEFRVWIPLKIVRLPFQLNQYYDEEYTINFWASFE